MNYQWPDEPGGKLSGGDAPAIANESFLRDCLSVLDHGSVETALVLLDHGDILFCSARGESLLAGKRNDIVGHHIADFISGTSISPLAPGSNVVHANYWGRNNLWREHRLRDARGDESYVGVQLDVLAIDLTFLILVRIRPAKPRGESDQDVPAACLPYTGKWLEVLSEKSMKQ